MSSAKCVYPGDIAPCDNDVNLTELIVSVNYWYRCSSCVPDLNNVINAYFDQYVPFQSDPGCEQAGSFCDGNLPYTCALNTTYGCFERTNGSECDPGTTCSDGWCLTSGYLGTTDCIEQWGITWTFDKEYDYGKFVNGDYWVIGPVTIESIDPPLEYFEQYGNTCNEDSDCKEYIPSCNAQEKCDFTRVYDAYFYPESSRRYFEPFYTNNLMECDPLDPIDGLRFCDQKRYYVNKCIQGTCFFNRTINSSEVDPFPDNQAFDSSAYYFNESSIFSAPNVLNPGNSLVSSITYPHNRFLYHTHVQRLETAAVLTVLDQIPPADAFRPAYARGNKTIYTLSQVNKDLLPDLEPPPDKTETKYGTYCRKDTPDMSIFAQNFERVWLDHFTGDSGRYRSVRPHSNMLDYSAESASVLSNAAMLLMLENTVGNDDLLVNVIQVGIDYYGTAKLNRCLWYGADGQSIGRKWPIVFAGIMLEDEEMAGIDICSEEGHTYYYNDPSIVDPARGKLDAYGFLKLDKPGWTGAKVLFGNMGQPGSRTSATSRDYEHVPPSDWAKIRPGTPLGGCKGEGYRRCCSSYSFVGEALSMRILENQAPETKASSYWTPAFMDYVDRWMTENFTHEQNDDLDVVACVINESTLEVLEYWYDLGRGEDFLRSSNSIFIDAMWDTYRADCGKYEGCLNVICQHPTTESAPTCEPPIENTMTCPQDCPLCIDDSGVCTDMECKTPHCDNGYCVYDINDSKGCNEDGWKCTINEYCSGGDCVGIPEDSECVNPTCTGGECRPDSPDADHEGCTYNFCNELVLHLAFDGDLDNTGYASSPLEIEWMNGEENYTNGMVDQAAFFKNQSHLLIKNSDAFNDMDNITIALWAQKKYPEIQGALISKHGQFHVSFTSFNANPIALSATVYNDTGFNFPGNLGDTYVIDERIKSGDWHHYAVTWDGKMLKYYIDGENAYETDLNNYVTVTRSNENDIKIGSFSIYHSGAGPFMIGTMDDLRIYMRTLSQTEIQALVDMGY